jgi:adenosylmethionine-8-amino-7-oxononanoate aminotransferase
MLSPAMHHVSACNAYRGQMPGESDADYTDRLAQELEDKILELGPNTVAAFLAEPVVGATMGAVPPVAGYFTKMKAVCDRHGVLMILDEVMCGMGRTGTLFACEQEGAEPDMIAIAKGLGAGFQPIGALLVSDRIYGAIESGSGFFQHGHTYLGHPMACAVGNAVLDSLVDDGVLGRVNRWATPCAMRWQPASAITLMSATSGAGGCSLALNWSPTVAPRKPSTRSRPCRSDQEESHGRGADVLPDERHNRRRAWGPHPACPALHHRRRTRRYDCRPSGNGN